MCVPLKGKALKGGIIMTRFATVSLSCAIGTALNLLSACGDVDIYKIRTSGWGETEPRTDLDGAVVQMVRVIVPCESGASNQLFALVGAQMEFPGQSVAAAKSSCSHTPEAAVDIDVEGRSIIYDFSNVVGPGEFASAEFNGYVFIDLSESGPEILSATVDRRVTTLELQDQDLVVDGHTVRANFSGLPFDQIDFVKIDLVFADAAQG